MCEFPCGRLLVDVEIISMDGLLLVLSVMFSPAGWDKDKKIAILYENFATVKQDDAYEDIIGKPLIKKVMAMCTPNFKPRLLS